MGRLLQPKSIIILLLALLLTALVSGCSTTAPSDQQSAANKEPVTAGKPEAVELGVWAATSLKDALTELARGFEEPNNVKLVFNFASSGDLQTQIEQGAPADVFISAGTKQMDALETQKFIDPASRVKLLGNSLAVVIPAQSNITLNSIEGIAALSSVKNIAIGNPDEVPAGKYAKQSLETAKIYDLLKSKLVLAKDVRQVLTYVERDEVEIGFIYASDLIVAKNIKQAFVVPDAYHDPITYPVAIVNSSKQSEIAARFIKYLQGEEASRVFLKYGFKPDLE